jgi:hypothetical protein
MNIDEINEYFNNGECPPQFIFPKKIIYDVNNTITDQNGWEELKAKYPSIFSNSNIKEDVGQNDTNTSKQQ